MKSSLRLAKSQAIDDRCGTGSFLGVRCHSVFWSHFDFPIDSNIHDNSHSQRSRRGGFCSTGAIFSGTPRPGLSGLALAMMLSEQGLLAEENARRSVGQPQNTDSSAHRPPLDRLLRAMHTLSRRRKTCWSFSARERAAISIRSITNRNSLNVTGNRCPAAQSSFTFQGTAGELDQKPVGV